MRFREKYPPDMKGVKASPIRLLAGGGALVAAGVLGYFESWGNFGAMLALATILLIGAYFDSWYLRIAKRLDRIEDMIGHTKATEDTSNIHKKKEDIKNS